MDALPKLSLNNRSFIALVCVIVAAIGIISMTILRQELIPSVQLPVVAVVGTNPGASSEQMSENIADPIERQLRTMDNVEGTSAVSQSNFTMITVELEYGSDIYRAASQADVILSRVESQLPEGTGLQVITGGTSDLPAMIVSVSSDLEVAELARRMELSTIPDLDSVPGIATVSLIGAAEEIVRLTIDEAAMAGAGASQADISGALDDAGLLLPGGSVTDGAVDVDITVGNAFGDIDDLASLLIVPDAEGATPVRLDEIATVERTNAATDSISRTDGRESVTLAIIPAVEANFVEISDAVTAVLNDSAEILGSSTEFTVIFDQAPFIQESISGLATEGAWGLVFAVVVIFVFLLAVRPTLITAVSIPMSLLFAFIGMLVTGTTMNIMSLAGLMLAIGRMVDDSIVVIENIVRHLSMSSKPRFRTIVDAVSEVAGAVISSTIVALLVFLPIALVPGLAGELFRPFALTTVIALTGSLLVSLTIVPVLAFWFLRGRRYAPVEATGDEDRTLEASTGWLARLYRPALSFAINHRLVTGVLALAIFAGSLAMIPLLKVNLLGDSGMNSIAARQTLPTGTVLEQSVEAAEATEAVLMELDSVESIQTSIGGGGFGPGGMGGGSTSTINYTITTDVDTDQAEVLAEIEQALSDHAASADGEIEVLDGSSFLGSGTVDVSINALDDETRGQANDLIMEALAGLDEVSQVTSDYAATAPSLEVTVREDDAAMFGLSTAQAVGLIAGSTAEFPVGAITLGGIDFDVYLGADREDVETVEDVENLDLGGIMLADIADVNRVEIAPSISTVNAVRTITVSATPANPDDVGTVGDDVAEVVASLELPDGVTWELGGVTADVEEAFGQLALAMIAAIMLIYVVLVWLFKSLLQPAILLVSIPFGATGVILALWLTDTPLGLPSLVGLLMLIGIVVTNAIVLIDLVNQYRRRGMSIEQAILRGGQNRVRPIIMTAAATIMAMVPPAFSLSGQSSFVSAPMAIAVIGGLIASTLITLIIVPVLYSALENVKKRGAGDGPQDMAAQDPADAPRPKRAVEA